jgi:hypothetical protein
MSDISVVGHIEKGGGGGKIFSKNIISTFEGKTFKITNRIWTPSPVDVRFYTEQNHNNIHKYVTILLCLQLSLQMDVNCIFVNI